jgi:hypothetical protein
MSNIGIKREILNVDYADLGLHELRNHFKVSLFAPDGIGLKLAETTSKELYVAGFNNITGNKIGPAEACGMIFIGDILTQVDDINLYFMKPTVFSDKISKYNHDKTVCNNSLIIF